MEWPEPELRPCPTLLQVIRYLISLSNSAVKKFCKVNVVEPVSYQLLQRLNEMINEYKAPKMMPDI